MASQRNAQTGAWSNWLLAVGYVGLVFSFQSAYAILSRSMSASLGLSLAEVGLVGSTYTWCFAAAQVVAGPLLDRVGAQRILPAACTLFALGVFCFGFANGLPGLLLSQVLLATGASFGFIGAGFVGGMWFAPERYGTMFAWVQFSASMIACVAQALAVLLVERFPWNWIVNGVGLSSLGLVVVFLLFLRDPAHVSMRGWPSHPLRFLASVTDDLLTALRRPGMVPLMLLGALSFGVMLSIGVVWGPRLGESFGFSAQASSLSAASWLGLALGAPVFARLARTRPAPVLLLVSYLLQIVLLASTLLLPAHSAEGFAVEMFLFGFVSGGSILPFMMAAHLVGARFAGTSAALVNGLQFIAGGVLMSLPGHLMATRIKGLDEVRTALTALPASMVIGLPLFFFLFLKPCADGSAQTTS